MIKNECNNTAYLVTNNKYFMKKGSFVKWAFWGFFIFFLKIFFWKC